jgi:hypothetical protein
MSLCWLLVPRSLHSPSLWWVFVVVVVAVVIVYVVVVVVWRL